MNPFKQQLVSDSIFSGLTYEFFGLTFEYNQKVFEQIFDLVYRGKGGFTFNDVYLMPVNLRSFYYMKLADCIVAENQAQQANNTTGKR